ncbi:MAG: 3,4-dihydroxy-2-butanone-4-phosphate synthase, partial [Bacillota bacterium]|nr:3,4-dihydroxy-2-butanone-4-phosphate synthase [Bacillota bacterium]
MFTRIEDGVESIKNGKMIILVDDESVENEGVLAMAAQLVSREAVNFMMKFARGIISVPLTEERIEELELPQLTEKIQHKQ